MAQAVTAVAVKPDAHDIQVVALAKTGNSDHEQKAFVIVTDAFGTLTTEPMLLPESALSGAGNPDLNRATILFDAVYNSIIALGHDDSRDFTTLLRYESEKFAELRRQDYHNFQLSSGNDNGCVMNLESDTISKVFLAGRSDTL